MHPVRLRTSVTVEASIERVFAFWSDLENFQTFIPALASIRVLDDVNSHWVIRAPLDYEVRFDSTIVEKTPPQRLVWVTRHNAGNARGELTFTGDTSRTHVELVFQYALASGWLQPVARLLSRLGFPARTLESGLAHIKRQIERCGEPG